MENGGFVSDAFQSKIGIVPDEPFMVIRRVILVLVEPDGNCVGTQETSSIKGSQKTSFAHVMARTQDN